MEKEKVLADLLLSLDETEATLHEITKTLSENAKVKRQIILEILHGEVKEPSFLNIDFDKIRDTSG
jgi:hypothetical protein